MNEIEEAPDVRGSITASTKSRRKNPATFQEVFSHNGLKVI